MSFSTLYEYFQLLKEVQTFIEKFFVKMTLNVSAKNIDPGHHALYVCKMY